MMVKVGGGGNKMGANIFLVYTTWNYKLTWNIKFIVHKQKMSDVWSGDVYTCNYMFWGSFPLQK